MDGEASSKAAHDAGEGAPIMDDVTPSGVGAACGTDEDAQGATGGEAARGVKPGGVVDARQCTRPGGSKA